MRANLQLNERAAPLSIALVGIPDAFMVRKWAPRMTQVTVATTTGAVSWTAPVVTGRSWTKACALWPMMLETPTERCREWLNGAVSKSVHGLFTRVTAAPIGTRSARRKYARSRSNSAFCGALGYLVRSGQPRPGSVAEVATNWIPTEPWLWGVKRAKS